jgi:hypothetical protein
MVEMGNILKGIMQITMKKNDGDVINEGSKRSFRKDIFYFEFST